jgi:hypothetical protein
MNNESKSRTVISANGTSAKDNDRAFTFVRTERVNEAGIIVIRFVSTPKAVQS